MENFTSLEIISNSNIRIDRPEKKEMKTKQKGKKRKRPKNTTPKRRKNNKTLWRQDMSSNPVGVSGKPKHLLLHPGDNSLVKYRIQCSWR